MISVKFQIDGRPVATDRLAAALMESLRPKLEQATKQKIEERLALVQCPIHHSSPTITRSGSSSEIEFSLLGCCEALKDEITKALK